MSTALAENQKTTGFEALARLYDSDGNLIGNEEFMPLIDARFQLDILLPQAINYLICYPNAPFRKAKDQPLIYGQWYIYPLPLLVILGF